MPRKKPVAHAAPLPFDPAPPAPPRVDQFEVRLSDAAATAALLAAAAHVERSFTATGDPWQGSPFNWIKQLATASRSKAAESIVATLLAAAGFRVAPRTAGGSAVVVEDQPVHVKFSTLWTSGAYVFQQLTPLRTEHLILLGVSPLAAHAWVVPAAVVCAHPTPEWLHVDPAAPPPLLTGRGGAPAAFLVAALTSFGPPSSLASGLPDDWAVPITPRPTPRPARRSHRGRAVAGSNDNDRPV